MKKYNGNRNIIGPIILSARKEKKLERADIVARVGILDVVLTEDEIYRIESNRMSAKDFEAVALCIALDIDYKVLIDIIKNNQTT